MIQPDPAFRPDRRLKMKVLGMDSISVNHDTIDLRCLEQLADPEQIQALSAILCYAERRLFNGKDTLQQIIDRLDTELSDRGLEILSEAVGLLRTSPCHESRKSMHASTDIAV